VILEALKAEIYKLVHNRWASFWAFGFMPALALTGGLLEQAYDRLALGGVIIYAAPLENSLEGFGLMSVSIFQICAIAGAALLFAGEYRWETWRAVLVRSDRIPLMLAKIAAFAIALMTSLLLCGLSGLTVGLIDAALSGAAIWPAVGAGQIALAHLLALGATFLQVMVAAGLVMLIAVLSRAMTASIIATLLILFACDIASVRGHAGGDPVWVMFLNIAAESIRQAGRQMMGDPDTLLAGLALPGLAGLAGVFVVLTGAALIVFTRQDLSRE